MATANHPSLIEVVSKFEKEIGNKPQTFNQLFNFCKHHNIGYNYSDIQTWWRNNYYYHNIHSTQTAKSIVSYEKNSMSKKYKNGLLNHKHCFINTLKKKKK
eukprot:408023_1